MPNTYIKVIRTEQGVRLRIAKVPLTTTAGVPNTVAHNLPKAPLFAFYVPANGDGSWYETAVPDGTNAYLTVGASGPTSFTMYAFY